MNLAVNCHLGWPHCHELQQAWKIGHLSKIEQHLKQLNFSSDERRCHNRKLTSSWKFGHQLSTNTMLRHLFPIMPTC